MNGRFQVIVHGAILGMLEVHEIGGPACLPLGVPHLERLLPVPIVAVRAIFLSRDGRQ